MQTRSRRDGRPGLQDCHSPHPFGEWSGAYTYRRRRGYLVYQRRYILWDSYIIHIPDCWRVLINIYPQPRRAIEILSSIFSFLYFHSIKVADNTVCAEVVGKNIYIYFLLKLCFWLLMARWDIVFSTVQCIYGNPIV